MKLRNCVPRKTRDERRKQLRALIRRGLSKIDPETISPFTFIEDIAGINHSLPSLREEIEKISTNSNSVTFERISTRLTHVISRINLSNPTNAEQTAEKKSFEEDLIMLEGEYLEKEDSFKVASLSLNTSATASHSMSNNETNDLSASPAILNVSTPVSSSVYHVPVCKWNLHFSGEKNSLPLTEFLQLVEEYKLSRGVSERELFHSATELFTGPALEFFRNIRDTISSWTACVDLLKTTFLPTSHERDLLRKIENTFQSASEKVTLFIYSMQGAFRKLEKPPSLEEQLQIVVSNLQPEFTRHLALAEFSSYTELISLCAKLENSFKSSRRSGLSRNNISDEISTLNISGNETPNTPERSRDASFRRNSTPISAHSKNAAKCWNCRRVGHSYSECKSPRSLFCYGCGRPDTYKSQCPICQPSTSLHNSKNESREVSMSATPRNTQSRSRATDLTPSSGAIRKTK